MKKETVISFRATEDELKFIKKLQNDFGGKSVASVINITIDYSMSVEKQVPGGILNFHDNIYNRTDYKKGVSTVVKKENPVQREKDPVMEEPEPEQEEKEAVKEVDNRYAFDFDTKAAEDLRKKHLKYPPPL